MYLTDWHAFLWLLLAQRLAASGADVLAVQQHGFGRDLAAEHAAALRMVLAQQDRVPVGEDLQRGVRGDVVGVAQFLRQDDAAKTVDTADDAGRKHFQTSCCSPRLRPVATPRTAPFGG